jgi:hypothetical protein
MGDEAGFISAYQTGIGQGDTFKDVVIFVISLINMAIPVLVALALVLFLWGAVRYIAKSADAHGKSADKEALLWGLIALFVLLSVWGILRILTNTFLGGSAGSGVPTSQQNPWMQENPWNFPGVGAQPY